MYTEEGALSDYWLAEEIMPLKDRPMYKGWNFVGITQDMTFDAASALDRGNAERQQYTLQNMKGSCAILKAFFFDNEHQSWVALPLTEPLQSNMVGFGIVMKVSANCRMTDPTPSAMGPPGLPT